MVYIAMIIGNVITLLIVLWIIYVVKWVKHRYFKGRKPVYWQKPF